MDINLDIFRNITELINGEEGIFQLFNLVDFAVSAYLPSPGNCTSRCSVKSPFETIKAFIVYHWGIS